MASNPRGKKQNIALRIAPIRKSFGGFLMYATLGA